MANLSRPFASKTTPMPCTLYYEDMKFRYFLYIAHAHAYSTFSATLPTPPTSPLQMHTLKIILKLHPHHKGWRWRYTIYMYSITACRHFAAHTADSKVVYMLFQELILK